MAEALNAAGCRPSPTARRARFTRDATRAMLASRFYVGELPIGKRGAAGWSKGAHEPLVPVGLFEAVQRQRARRTTQANPFHVNNASTSTRCQAWCAAAPAASRCTSRGRSA